MAKLPIVGLDPSMSNFGLSYGWYDLETRTVSIEGFVLVETHKENKKTVRVNSDDLRRASEIVKRIKSYIDKAALVFAELPVGSQSSRGQTNYGICLGILSAIEKPLIQVTPNDIKQLVGGKKTTSKQEVIDWAVERHPDAPWLTRKSKGEVVMVSKNEHLADSVAAIYAGLDTDQFKQISASLAAIYSLNIA